MMNTDNTGIIKALDAAKFLMKSGLSDVVLSRVSIFSSILFEKKHEI